MSIPFAQETLDTIIDFAWYDSKLLANWALVHRNSVPASRHHLFNTVYITRRNCHVWFEILNASTATVPHYVKHIQIRWDERIAFKDAAVYFIHPKLVKVGKLSLSGIVLDGDTLDLSGLSRIAELELSSMAAGSYMDLFSTVSHFQSLTRLGIWDAQMKSYEQPPRGSSYAKTPPLLRSLALNMNAIEPYLQWLISSNIALTDVSAAVHCYSLQLLSHESVRVLSLAKLFHLRSNLVRLDLDLRLCDFADSEAFKQMMNFSRHPNLRALHLHISNSNFHSSNWFHTSLKSICPPDPIREHTGLKLLMISIGWNACKDLRQEVEDEDASSTSEDADSDVVHVARWKELDTLLNTRRFAGLEELWFVFEMCSGDELRGFIRWSCLPACQARGIISMSDQDCMDGPDSWDRIPW